MNLKIVRDEFHLMWHPTVTNPVRHRGAPGYVVDLDEPLEAEWCEGQMHKLRDLTPEEAEEHEGPSDLGFAAPRKLREDAREENAGKKPRPAKKVSKKLAENARKAKAGMKATGIPKPEKPEEEPIVDGPSVIGKE